jgi:hypothetical protein
MFSAALATLVGLHLLDHVTTCFSSFCDKGAVRVQFVSWLQYLMCAVLLVSKNEKFAQTFSKK